MGIRKNASAQKATKTDYGVVKLNDGTPVDSGDPYYGYTLVSGPADKPSVPIVGQLVQVFSAWVSQLFLDDGAGNWNLKRSALDTRDPWSTEILLASPSTARANGYVEGIGGVTADRAITLKTVLIRVPDWAVNVGGSGNLNIQLYNGTATTEGTLMATATLASGANSTVYTLPAPVSVAQNNVLRAKLVVNSTTGNGLQVQWRGEYQ